MKRKLDQAILDSMSNNLSNWRGTFYFNRNDPRIIVPKFNRSLGWTLNWSNPYSYIAAISILLIIIATSIFL